MSVRRWLPSMLAAAALVLAGQPPAGATHAAPGDLDLSFSGDGRTTAHVGLDGQVAAIAAQGTRLIVGGQSTTSAGNDWLIIRYRANGTVDRTFGQRGRVRLDFGGDDRLGDLLVMPNGTIVAVGGARGRFGIVQLTQQGRLDRSFAGGDGVARTSFGTPFAAATQVVRVSRGRIVVAGNAGSMGDSRFALARYQANGRLDRTFSGDGKVLAGFWTGEEQSQLSELLRWGRSDLVLAVGETSSSGPTGFDIALASFTAKGRLDRSFGGDGRTVQHVTPNDYVAGAVMQPHGTVLVGGYGDLAGGWDAMFARFNASGHLDTGWGGGDGVVLRDAGTDLEYWLGMARTGRKVVMVGQVDGDAATMRVGRSGAMDTGFGTGGWAVTPFGGGQSRLHAATRDGAGRLLVGGRAPATLAADGFAVARLRP